MSERIWSDAEYTLSDLLNVTRYGIEYSARNRAVALRCVRAIARMRLGADAGGPPRSASNLPLHGGNWI